MQTRLRIVETRAAGPVVHDRDVWVEACRRTDFRHCREPGRRDGKSVPTGCRRFAPSAGHAKHEQLENAWSSQVPIRSDDAGRPVGMVSGPLFEGSTRPGMSKLGKGRPVLSRGPAEDRSQLPTVGRPSVIMGHRTAECGGGSSRRSSTEVAAQVRSWTGAEPSCWRWFSAVCAVPNRDQSSNLIRDENPSSSAACRSVEDGMDR